MTITSTEANAIATKVQADRAERERKTALEYLRTKIEPIIREEAECGHYSACFTAIPYSITTIQPIEDELRAKGFTINGGMRTAFTIKW